ncbi:hypothetical protein BDZ89DRAFT_1145010 [Hymenopellis radicata]|nr:hypothetical protein BDZ89DRAFT_1145010 [Hymenopellis radicata]
MYKPLTNHRRPPKQIFFLVCLTVFIVCIGYLRGFSGAQMTNITFKSVTVVQSNTPPSGPIDVSNADFQPLKAKEFGRPAVPPPPKSKAPSTHTTGKHRFRSNGLVSVSPDPATSHPFRKLSRTLNASGTESSRERVKPYIRPSSSTNGVMAERRPWVSTSGGHTSKNTMFNSLTSTTKYLGSRAVLGYSPKDLGRIELEFEAHRDSYTLGKEAGGIIKMVNYSLPEELFGPLTDGAMSVIESLEDVEEFIPRSGRGPPLSTQPLERVSMKYHGWLSACAPLSPAWKDPIDFNAALPPPSPVSTTKSFIFDHRKAMDPCQHPSLLRHHGQFLPFHKGPFAKSLLIPSFSVAGEYNESHDCSWEEKWDARLEWRGMNTGIWAGGDHEWRSAHRARMAEWATRDFDTNLTLLNWMDGEGDRETFITVSKARYAPAMLDIGFTGPPSQCAEHVCSALEALYPFNVMTHTPAEAYRYKFILDVDGNGWSSRFHRLMSTRSLIFKSTVYAEWWLDRAQEWVHYVPVQNDYSDLWDALVWFRGGLDGEGAHDAEAKGLRMRGALPDLFIAHWKGQFLGHNIQTSVKTAHAPDA